jgi:nitroimidazol reductase NimA-like FMN-containing flavoprotein (pyridoxamine 5'-phosphate oxidase superfamily)
MSVALNGPWSHAQIDEYLQASTIPLRLASVASDGFPRVVSVWYRYLQGRLHCVSHRDSKLIGLLRENDRVGFEVAPNEPPYCGVRGQGIAQLSTLGGADDLERLLERYLGGAESSLGDWLLSRSDEEMLISIEPRRMFSWDYRQRMRDISKPDAGDSSVSSGE